MSGLAMRPRVDNGVITASIRHFRFYADKYFQEIKKAGGTVSSGLLTCRGPYGPHVWPQPAWSRISRVMGMRMIFGSANPVLATLKSTI